MNRFVNSIKLVPVVLLLYSSPAMSAAAINFFYAPVTSAESDGESLDDDPLYALQEETAVGFLFDWVADSPFGLAIDIYNFDREYEITDSQALGYNQYTEEWAIPSFGFRYHTEEGFSIGAGLAFPSVNVKFYESPSLLDLGGESAVFDNMGLSVTLGYRNVWPDGFTLGAQLFYLAPTDVDIDQICRGPVCIKAEAAEGLIGTNLALKDIEIRLFGILIGYSW